MAVRHRCEGHLHVRLDLGRPEGQELVLYHGFEVGLAALEHEVQVSLVRKAIDELDDVRVSKLLQQLDLADGREVHPFLELSQTDLLDGDGLVRHRVRGFGDHAERALSQRRSLHVSLHALRRTSPAHQPRSVRVHSAAHAPRLIALFDGDEGGSMDGGRDAFFRFGSDDESRHLCGGRGDRCTPRTERDPPDDPPPVLLMSQSCERRASGGCVLTMFRECRTWAIVVHSVPVQSQGRRAL